MKFVKKHWGIVGGGMLGMHLAHLLAKKGHRVTLLEAAEEVGGLASSWKLGDYRWDKFYHVILLSDSRLRELLEEIGLGGELNWVETKSGFFTDGNLHSMSNSLEFLQFPPLSLIDKLRLAGTIFYASRLKDWEKLEKIPVDQWLRKLSGNRTFEKIWLPLLRAKLGEHYRQTSAAFIWATIQRMYAARRTGLKKEMFGYVSGGYARILNVFAGKLEEEGVEIKTGFKAERVCHREHGQVEIVATSGSRKNFDEVIVTVPSTIAAKLCEGLDEKEKNRHRSIQYLGVVCASLLIKQSLSPYYVTNITDPTPFTGVIEMTNVVDPRYFGGHTLIYLPKYAKRSDPIFQKSDQEIKAFFWDNLRQMYPRLTDEDLVDIKIARSPNVFALSTLGYSQKLPSVHSGLPGVHILNSAHIVNGTLNVNETLQVAETHLPLILKASSKNKNAPHHGQTIG